MFDRSPHSDSVLHTRASWNNWSSRMMAKLCWWFRHRRQSISISRFSVTGCCCCRHWPDLFIFNLRLCSFLLSLSRIFDCPRLNVASDLELIDFDQFHFAFFTDHSHCGFRARERKKRKIVAEKTKSEKCQIDASGLQYFNVVANAVAIVVYILLLFLHFLPFFSMRFCPSDWFVLKLSQVFIQAQVWRVVCDWWTNNRVFEWDIEWSITIINVSINHAANNSIRLQSCLAHFEVQILPTVMSSRLHRSTKIEKKLKKTFSRKSNKTNFYSNFHSIR